MEISDVIIQTHYDSGEAEMEHLTEVVEKVKQFCEENRIRFDDVRRAIKLFEKMGWGL